MAPQNTDVLYCEVRARHHATLCGRCTRLKTGDNFWSQKIGTDFQHRFLFESQTFWYQVAENKHGLTSLWWRFAAEFSLSL